MWPEESPAEAKSQEPMSLKDRRREHKTHHIKRIVFSSVESADDLWEVSIALQSGLELTFASLSVSERIKNLGAELILSVAYMIILAWFVVMHIGSLANLVQLAGVVVPQAMADTPSLQSPRSIKIAILTTYSFGLFVVLLMSAYAAMLRKPPLQSAKDILKLVLGFITGQLTLAGFLT